MKVLLALFLTMTRVLRYEYGAAVSAPLMVNQRCNVSKFRRATKLANCSALEGASGVEAVYGTRRIAVRKSRLASARGDKSTAKKPKACGGEDHRHQRRFWFRGWVNTVKWKSCAVERSARNEAKISKLKLEMEREDGVEISRRLERVACLEALLFAASTRSRPIRPQPRPRARAEPSVEIGDESTPNVRG